MTFPEKLKLIREANNLTQDKFADSISISKEQLLDIERGNIPPTPLLINYISLTYDIDRYWLFDDNNNDISELNKSTAIVSLIREKYELLDDKYKKFVENQIYQLLQAQDKKTNFYK